MVQMGPHLVFVRSKFPCPEFNTVFDTHCRNIAATCFVTNEKVQMVVIAPFDNLFIESFNEKMHKWGPMAMLESANNGTKLVLTGFNFLMAPNAELAHQKASDPAGSIRPFNRANNPNSGNITG